MPRTTGRAEAIRTAVSVDVTPVLPTLIGLNDELHAGGPFGNVCSDGLDEALAIEREHRIPTLLEADCRHGLSAQAGAACGSGEVCREDLETVGKHEQFLVETHVEVVRAPRGVARQVGSSDSADEERVASQHEPRIGAATKVGDDQANALGSMPRRMKHIDPDVAELDLQAVFHRGELECDDG